jgi:hypothetical protein
MAQTYNPTSFIEEIKQALSDKARIWIQSVHQQINGNLSFSDPTGTAPTTGGGVNAGVYTQFQKSNGSGILIRVAAYGVTGTGAPYNWPAAGALTINHGLGRQPIGFHIIDVDTANFSAYRSAAPTAQQIQITPSTNTASVTLHIL